MTRQSAVDTAESAFLSGAFVDQLAQMVAARTVSVDADPAPLEAYLTDIIAPRLQASGFETEMAQSDADPRNRFLVASRIEDPAAPTVLFYGHGDVVQGMDAQWRDGLSPWRLTQRGDRLYGRGAADNKGQHAVNLTALEAVLKVRGRLGFNAKMIFEMGEEIGSPALRDFCRARARHLAADLLLASDGPRLDASTPTMFLGARGALQIRLTLEARPGAHHSGNWGGLISNPATIIANAIASLVDGRGVIAIDALRPPPMPLNVRASLAGLELAPGADDPPIEQDWGEPGLTPAERVFGWNTIETLALHAGDVRRPMNAIPGRAEAACQLRFVVGTNVRDAEAAIKKHLAAHGFGRVGVQTELAFNASRLDPDDPWVRRCAASLERTMGRAPAVLPNIGGSLPNDIFVDELGLKTIWIPHSYPGCSQHAPNEHVPTSVIREGLRIMAGVIWDIGAQDG
ncbi:MAG: M20 family metallopeptidase [Hyphomicrobiales bacterium]|nr:M20 family metallopeptidase [Hyphomicrobiales bacterium]